MLNNGLDRIGLGRVDGQIGAAPAGEFDARFDLSQTGEVSDLHGLLAEVVGRFPEPGGRPSHRRRASLMRLHFRVALGSRDLREATLETHTSRPEIGMFGVYHRAERSESEARLTYPLRRDAFLGPRVEKTPDTCCVFRVGEYDPRLSIVWPWAAHAPAGTPWCGRRSVYVRVLLF